MTLMMTGDIETFGQSLGEFRRAGLPHPPQQPAQGLGGSRAAEARPTSQGRWYGNTKQNPTTTARRQQAPKPPDHEYMPRPVQARLSCLYENETRDG